MDSLIKNSRISRLFNESKSNITRVFEEVKKVAKDDPRRAGGDLRHLVALNIELLASSLEGLSTEYFVGNDNEGEDVGKDKKNPFKGYQSVLNSKGTEEALPPLEMDTTTRLVLHKLSSESGKALSNLARSVGELARKASFGPCTRRW
ncbi:Aluminum-activated malate transporter 10 [Acorus calamus]|uniref:Aluminum-activated malate transporter 10 n=1 Tax=Acorus calamus TaxID=4465 RepID=A0AAV9DIB8_ACOCL|nr:Aluminum-activated malate transporter 10 [Acorus calamus]